MPILDLQRRLREAGRIRIGQQVASSNGKKRPAKLERFRLTSADKVAIDAAAALYGGEPHLWADAPIGEQYEIFTETNTMPVIIPPAAAALSQWWELWSGGGCTRRCDGEREVLSEQPCVCNTEEDDRQCKPTTRLNVILRDLPGLGVWRLETHGFNAATELAGTVEICMAAASRGQLLPAVLRLEQRQVKRIVDGKATTRNFAVPTLDIALAPTAIGVVLGHPAIDTPAPAELPATTGPAWQPVPPPAELTPAEGFAAIVEQAKGEAVADQIRQPRPPEPKRPPAKNAAEPIRPTGLRPRGAPAPDTNDTGPAAITDAQNKQMRALYSGLKITDADEQRHISALIVGVDVASHNDLTTEQASKLIDRLKALATGKWEFVLDSDATVVGTRAAQPPETAA
jgi:hypothetical protein